MKQKSSLLIGAIVFLLGSCIETDEVEDTISSISIVPPENVTIVNEGNFAKVLGQEALLQVEAKSDLGGTFIAAAQNLTWSSSDPSIVSVSAEGMVIAVGIGTATISVTFSAENTTPISDDVEISVAGDEDAIALIEITSPDNLLIISPSDEILLSGRSLTATGVEVSISTNLVWSSSDVTVATVTQEGLVTAIADGEVRITAVMDEVSGFIDLIVGTATALTRTANFEGLSGYSASGDAVLEMDSIGSITLRFANNFMVQNGPGLFVYLSNSSNQITGAVELGALKEASGAQNYFVPGEVGLNDFDHIVIYCKPFGVGFGTAPLSD